MRRQAFLIMLFTASLILCSCSEKQQSEGQPPSAVVPAVKGDRPLLAALRHYAGSRREKHEVERLIAQGADVNAVDDSGMPPLCIAADDPEIVRLLLDHGANIDAQDADGRSALFFAGNVGNKETFELLISRGADVNLRDEDGNTVLMWATGNPELLNLLLKAGADPAVAANDGKTALDIALKKQARESVRLLRQALVRKQKGK